MLPSSVAASQLYLACNAILRVLEGEYIGQPVIFAGRWTYARTYETSANLVDVSTLRKQPCASSGHQSRSMMPLEKLRHGCKDLTAGDPWPGRTSAEAVGPGGSAPDGTAVVFSLRDRYRCMERSEQDKEPILCY
jgi:hypothetical protein